MGDVPRRVGRADVTSTCGLPFRDQYSHVFRCPSNRRKSTNDLLPQSRSDSSPQTGSTWREPSFGIDHRALASGIHLTGYAPRLIPTDMLGHTMMLEAIPRHTRGLDNERLQGFLRIWR